MRTNAMTIRAATSADTGAIRRLAASSTRPVPAGPCWWPSATGR